MPVTKQTLAIIESRGDIGTAIARGVNTGNYRLLLVNEDREKNRGLAEELQSINPDADIELLACSHTGCWEADTIIVSVEAGEWPEIAKKIEEVSTQKVVVGTIDAPSHEATEVKVDVQKSLPYSKVVEVTEAEPSGASPSGANGSRTLELYSVYEDALETATHLLRAAGFKTIPSRRYHQTDR